MAVADHRRADGGPVVPLMAGFDTVLFDLDGTLTDPKVGITTSIRYALDKLGVVHDPVDDLTWCIGPPIQRSFERLLGPDNAVEGVRLYRERYAAGGMFENEMFPGIDTTLATLQGEGIRLFVATSKAHVFARPIVAHFGLDPYFIAVEGAELDGTRSDKGEVIAHVLASHGVDPVRAIMIGDREHDIIGARKNGLRSIGVLYGYGDEAELLAAGADDLCQRPADLLATLARFA
ncbi:HAD family hydrolase [Dongia rigui]|uniref:HAD family hydrolase n=1 Tax=Dongia rigui TaxID=940149 RepID=A0ABU5DWW9_9PROT|nr:HAD family hydrolase [Dongia rigui]MDY0871808.1 HAD family hydrolase [Dongia rigui]